MAKNIGGNLILSCLAPECRAFLEERMLTKPIASGEVLYEPNAPLQNLIFLHSGLVSLQHTLKDGRTVEKMMVGTDGVVGAEYLMGDIRFPCHAVTVISGRAKLAACSGFHCSH